MNYEKSFWRKGVYDLIMAGCGLFIILTTIAMFFYPGGTTTDHNTRGYSFFENFFSELGYVRTYNGEPNTISFSLFVIALTMGGAGLLLFSIAFRRSFLESRPGRILSAFAAVAGVMAGIYFIGTTFVPGDINLDLHIYFVLWAFRLFPVSVLFYTIAMAREKYPRAYLCVYAVFFLLLIAYMFLLEFGPDYKTPQGMVIQAIGQKIIAYATIASVMIQAWGAKQRA